MDMVDSNCKEMRGKACDVWYVYTRRTIAILHDLYVTSENATGPRLQWLARLGKAEINKRQRFAKQWERRTYSRFPEAVHTKNFRTRAVKIALTDGSSASETTPCCGF